MHELIGDITLCILFAWVLGLLAHFSRQPLILAYLVAGVGVNYQQNGRVILAPMRTGVGLRLGANVGYLHYSKERNILPF